MGKTGNGKLPPQAIDVENAVIGAVVHANDAMIVTGDILKPEMFYLEKNQIIYQAATDIAGRGEQVEVISISQQLRKIGKLEMIGGAFHLAELSDGVLGTTNLEYQCRIISEKYFARALLSLSTETAASCYDESKDIFETLDMYESERDQIIGNVTKKKETTNADALNEWRKYIDHKSEQGEGEVSGIDSGFNEQNKLTGGWQKAELTILAARPGMGKTSLMLSYAYTAAKQGIPVMIFSLEMSKNNLMDKLVSMVTGIELWKIKKPNSIADHEWQRLDSKHQEISELPIIWDDTASIGIMELSAKAKRAKRKYGVQMVFIDYLQLIQESDKKSMNREREISKISRSLKILSKEMDIPVMALSQLSRAVESRPGNSKRPMLSDLRESGSIEQDADSVIFIYRAEYYGITEDESGRPTIGVAEIIFAKNRNGGLDTIEVSFVGKLTSFIELENGFNNDDGFVHPKDFSLPSNNLNGHSYWSNSDDTDDSPF